MCLGQFRCASFRALPHGAPSPWWRVEVSATDFDLGGSMILAVEVVPSTADIGRYHLSSSCHSHSLAPSSAWTIRQRCVRTSTAVLVIRNSLMPVGSNTVTLRTSPPLLAGSQVLMHASISKENSAYPPLSPLDFRHVALCLTEVQLADTQCEIGMTDQRG